MLLYCNSHFHTTHLWLHCLLHFIFISTHGYFGLRRVYTDFILYFYLFILSLLIYWIFKFFYYIRSYIFAFDINFISCWQWRAKGRVGSGEVKVRRILISANHLYWRAFNKKNSIESQLWVTQIKDWAPGMQRNKVMALEITNHLDANECWCTFTIPGSTRHTVQQWTN